MTLEEMKKKELALIEELNPNSEFLTDDPDIAAKINYVNNQIMYELCRIKKLARYAELEVKEGQLVTFDDIGKVVGNNVYQLATVSGVDLLFKANGTVLKILESGTLEVDCYVYPEAITEKTRDKAYEFELTEEVLEIMPYGVAADLLKSDISTEYGAMYANRYEQMLQRLDPRNSMPMIYIEGGANI